MVPRDFAGRELSAAAIILRAVTTSGLASLLRSRWSQSPAAGATIPRTTIGGGPSSSRLPPPSSLVPLSLSLSLSPLSLSAYPIKKMSGTHGKAYLFSGRSALPLFFFLFCFVPSLFLTLTPAEDDG